MLNQRYRKVVQGSVMHTVNVIYFAQQAGRVLSFKCRRFDEQKDCFPQKFSSGIHFNFSLPMEQQRDVALA